MYVTVRMCMCMHMYMHELHLHIQCVALKGNSNITNMFLNNYKRAIFVYNVCNHLRKVIHRVNGEWL